VDSERLGWDYLERREKRRGDGVLAGWSEKEGRGVGGEEIIGRSQGNSSHQQTLSRAGLDR